MYAHQLLCLIKDKRKSQAARSQTRRLCSRKVVKKYSRLWYYCGQTKNHRQFGGDFSRSGGPERDRTVDLSDANRTLSQLSYRPILEQGGCPAPMIIHIFGENATLFLRPYSITGSFATTAAQRGHSSGNCSLAPTSVWCFQQRRHFWPLASVTITRTPAMGVSLPSA